MKLVNVVPSQDLKKFIVAELRKDDDLLGRFSAVFAKAENARGGKDYRAIVQGRFDRAKGRKGYIDRFTTRSVKFTDIMAEAKACERVGDYAGAARIYSETSESIDYNFPWVYSGSGRYYNMGERCIERIILCAKKARGTNERRTILRYLLRGWAAQPDDLSDYKYENAMKSMASGPDDFRHMVEVLDAGMPVIYSIDHRGSVRKHRQGMREILAKHARG